MGALAPTGDRLMTTQVIHHREAPEGWEHNQDYIYIGRYNSHYGLQRSLWHNPYKMRPFPELKNDGLPKSVRKQMKRLWDIQERERVINAYHAHLKYNATLQAHLHELKDKILVCWCSPLACHGDVLAKAADNLLSATVAHNKIIKPLDTKPDLNDLDAWLNYEAA